MDLEGFAKRGLRRHDPEVASKLAAMIMEVKDISRDQADKLAKAVLEEARATLNPRGEVFSLEDSGVTMGDFGVGSRGSGALTLTPRSPRSSAGPVPWWTQASSTTQEL